MTGHYDKYKDFLDQLARIPATLRLVIAGNHDYELDANFYRTKLSWLNKQNPDDVLALFKSYKEKGIEYLDEGYYEYMFDDGRRFVVAASPWQPEYGDMAFNYPREQDHFAGFTPRADILVTHGPPWGVLDMVDGSESVGCQSLRTAVRRVSPKLHVFGHIHEGYGVKMVRRSKFLRTEAVEEELKNGLRRVNTVADGREGCLAVNAALLDRRYERCREPWLVQVALDGDQT